MLDKLLQVANQSGKSLMHYAKAASLETGLISTLFLILNLLTQRYPDANKAIIVVLIASVLIYCLSSFYIRYFFTEDSIWAKASKSLSTIGKDKNKSAVHWLRNFFAKLPLNLFFFLIVLIISPEYFWQIWATSILALVMLVLYIKLFYKEKK